MAEDDLPIPEFPLLGARVHAMTMDDLHSAIASAIRLDQQWIVANHNQHSIYLFHHDPAFRAFFSKAKFTHIDGMSLIMLGRLLGHPFTRQERVTYVDWVRPLMCEAATSGWRVFFLGGRPGVAEHAAERLRSEIPSLIIGTAHGYFDQRPEHPENLERIQEINAFQTDVLMVGLGMPRQEKWILSNLESLHAHAILPSGACMDYVAGTIPTPPRWMGQLGVEWAYRLATEPRRLWKRYLIEPWYLLYRFIPEWSAHRFRRRPSA